MMDPAVAVIVQVEPRRSIWVRTMKTVSDVLELVTGLTGVGCEAEAR